MLETETGVFSLHEGSETVKMVFVGFFFQVFMTRILKESSISFKR